MALVNIKCCQKQLSSKPELRISSSNVCLKEFSGKAVICISTTFILMALKVHTHGSQGSYSWLSRFILMALKVHTHGSQGSYTWLSRFILMALKVHTHGSQGSYSWLSRFQALHLDPEECHIAIKWWLGMDKCLLCSDHSLGSLLHYSHL